MRRPLLLCVLALLALPAPARAGDDYVLANASYGAYPHVTAGPAGVFDVVWNDPGADTIVYCRVLAGKAGCDRTAGVAFGATGESLDPGPAWAIRGKTPGTIYLVAAQYVSAKTYVWTSTDDGVSFGAPRKLWGGASASQGTSSERPLYFPANDSIAFPTWNAGLFAYDVKLDGSEAASNEKAVLDTTGVGSSQYRLNLATLSNGTVATADDLTNVFAWVAPLGSDLSKAASWGAPRLVGPGTDSTMAGVDTSTYLGSTVNQDGKGRFEVRRWTGTAFGAPVVVANDPGYVANLAVSEHGLPGVVFRKNGVGLRYAASADGGKTFATKTIATGDEIFFDVQLARDDDGQGLAVWRRDGAIAAADLTEVADPSTPAVSKTVTKRKKTVGLNLTGSCVPAGGKFRATSGGAGKGKIAKIVYTAAGDSETDTTSRFGVTLRLPASTEPGSTVPVRAVATVKRKSGAFKITVVSAVRACGG